MLVITDMRARLRHNDSQLVNLQADFIRLLDAQWDEVQLARIEAIRFHLAQARADLAGLIESTPAYEVPTEHHEEE